MKRLWLLSVLWLLVQSMALGQVLVSTEKDGIQMEMWTESWTSEWSSFEVYCSITNVGSDLYIFEVDHRSGGTPALYMTMESPEGRRVEHLKLPPSFGRLAFWPYEGEPFGVSLSRLYPGESLTVRFRPQDYFDRPNPGGCRLKASWNTQFGTAKPPESITLELLLPDRPLETKSAVRWPGPYNYTTHELVRRDDDLDSKMQPMLRYEKRRAMILGGITATAVIVLLTMLAWLLKRWRHMRNAVKKDVKVDAQGKGACLVAGDGN